MFVSLVVGVCTEMGFVSVLLGLRVWVITVGPDVPVVPFLFPSCGPTITGAKIQIKLKNKWFGYQIKMYL